jgi:pimeloyl-ACP methyl ester carboxylesterase
MAKEYAPTKLGQVHCRIGGEGTPIVLLSAAGRSSRMYDALAALLASRFTTIAIDIPGSGSSDPLPQDASIEHLAQCVTDVLAHLKLAPAHVYGMHTGNKIAVAMAAHFPDRVRDIVLVGQSHSIIPDRTRRNAAVQAIVSEYFDNAADWQKWARLERAVAALWWPEAVVAAQADRDSRLAASALMLDALQSSESIETLYRANIAYDLEGDLRRLHARTLVLEVVTPHEERDLGRQGPGVVALMHNATLATIEEPAGHTLTLENRAHDLARILNDFLD